MKFDYSVYYWTMFLLPIGVLFIAIFNFYATIRDLFVHFISVEDIIKCLLGVVLSAVFGRIGLLPLLRGGIALYDEAASEGVTQTGYIDAVEAIDPVGGLPFIQNGEKSYGFRITIKGVKYTLMQLGNFKIGDKVCILVLPRSKCILSISHA